MKKSLCGVLIACLLSVHCLNAQELNFLALNSSKSFSVDIKPDNNLSKKLAYVEYDSASFPLSLFEEKTTKVSPKSFIFPATLVAAGSITLATNGISGINEYAKGKMYRDGYEHNIKIDNYTMFVPWVAVYGLHIAGVKGQHNTGEATLLYAMSSVISNSIVYSTKGITRIERPNGKSHAFPSGHTAQAFVSAEFMRQEYKIVSPWYGAAGYAVAIGTGVLRMYHNKHWFSDVIAGAGVGILSTRFSYWAYPKLKKALGFTKSDIAIAPSYSNGSYGISAVYQF